jgi:thioredoxin-related protein
VTEPLANVKSMIIVFAMNGCPACEEFKPRFEKTIDTWRRKHQVPFVWFRQGHVFAPGQIPVLIVDAASTDPSVVALADQYQVSALPSTVLFTRYGAPVKLEGALDDQQLYELLVAAANASR